MRTKSLLLICILVLSLIIACKKGETGPEGPQGPTGATGPQGQAGVTGSANVMYSEWLSVAANEWKDTVMANYKSTKRILKTAPALTQPILDSGVILVYLKDPENNIYQLPFTYNTEPARFYGYIPTLGKFVFFEYALDGSGGFASTQNKYRYIIIPGGVKTGKTTTEWKQMSYKEACKNLGITE